MACKQRMQSLTLLSHAGTLVAAGSTHPVKLHPEVPHQIGVLEALKDLQLVCRFLDGLVVIGLKADLQKVGQVSAGQASRSETNPG